MLFRSLLILSFAPNLDETLIKKLLPRLNSDASGLFARYKAFAYCRVKAWHRASDEIQRAMSLQSGGDPLDCPIVSLSYAGMGQWELSKSHLDKAIRALGDGGPINTHVEGSLAIRFVLDEAKKKHEADLSEGPSS